VALNIVRNSFRYLLQGAARSWARNLGSTAPALGSMTLLLLLSGIVGLLALAARNLAQAEARDASVLHVYLRDDAASEQVNALKVKLQSDARVRGLTYVTKGEALARAQRRPGLPDLADAADANPFPASFDVQVARIEDVGQVDAMVRHEAAVDPLFPTSYDKGAYQRIQRVMLGLALGGLALMGLLAFIAIAVTANSIRAAILARRDEVSIMQLVGAPRWMVKGPFLVEGALTGFVAGSVAAVVIIALTVAAIRAGAGTFAQVAPGVTVHVGLAAAALIVVAGLLLGSGSSILGLRRHIES
jgi:cell division transport system permease protein